MFETSTILLCSALFLIIAHVLIVLLFAWGGIFRKAGYHPAMLFIPVYGIYLCYRIAESEKLFLSKIIISLVAYLGVEIITGPYSIGGKGYPDGAVIALLVLGAIVGTVFLILNVLFCVRLSKLFGKEGGKAAGFLVFSPVFFAKLAYGDARYTGYGRRHSRDFFAESAVWTCPDCGEKNPAHRACCSCGTAKPLNTTGPEAD